MRVTVLGCGGSAGVPVIGNNWGACNPDNPKNRRLRPSVLVEARGVTLLIDTTPDLRQQLLTADVRRIDAVLYSHAHADHCHGIDELREVNRLMQQPIATHGSANTLADIQDRFGYCFRPLPPGANFYRPVLTPVPVDGPFEIGGVRVVPFAQDHGFSVSIGYRIGPFAYSTDVMRLDENAFAVLDGVTVWVVDCVRIEPPHPVHAHLEVTLAWIARVRPERAYLTHMNHTVDYDELAGLVPQGVAPAYDGLVIEIDDEGAGHL